MNITAITGSPFSVPRIERTDEDMRHEFRYNVAEQITQKLLDSGYITPVEFHKIMAKNREKFSPAIAKIVPRIT